MSVRARRIFALVFPIACLAGLTTHRQLRVLAGTTLVVRIAGYDPRDLLSGHYLTYRLDLGDGGTTICRADRSSLAEKEREKLARQVLVCGRAEGGVLAAVSRLEPESLSPPAVPPGCEVVLRGRCEHDRFVAGVERFYVPEEHAAALERALQSRRGAVVLAVDRSGGAAVKDLLVDGKPWREAIRERGR